MTDSAYSRSPSRHDQDRDHDMTADDRKRDRPEEEEQPVKRARAEPKKEDRARGKRLFGNILGTLQQFKKEDKSARTSEAAKRREEIKERIETKVRSEASLHTEIAETDRELKSLRIHTESLEYVLKHKEAALVARHKTLKPTSRFLHTSTPAGALIFEHSLVHPSPIPLNKGPMRDAQEVLRPLYFLPKILLPEQQSTLDLQIANIDNLITSEAHDLEEEKQRTANTAERNKARMVELGDKLRSLQAQPKARDESGPGARERGNRGERERGNRGEEESREGSGRDARNGRDDRDRDARRTRERDDRDERDQPPHVDREVGVQIRGDDGDVEVEY